MKKWPKIVLAVVLVAVPASSVLLTGPADAAPRQPTSDNYEISAAWNQEVRKNGQTTDTQIRIHLYSGTSFNGMDLEVITQVYSGDKQTSALDEYGSVSMPVSVAADLSSASLPPVSVPLAEAIWKCPPSGTDCYVLKEKPTRTVTVSASWIATAPAEKPLTYCVDTGVLETQTYRQPEATGTFDGRPLGSADDNLFMVHWVDTQSNKCN